MVSEITGQNVEYMRAITIAKRNVYIHTLMCRKKARRLYTKMITTEWYD